MSKEIKGFSKLTKKEKIEWLSKSCFKDGDSAKKILTQYWNIDSNLQKLHDEFSENTISNYYLPFAIAPNFLINNKREHMRVIEDRYQIRIELHAETNLISPHYLIEKPFTEKRGKKITENNKAKAKKKDRENKK